MLIAEQVHIKTEVSLVVVAGGIIVSVLASMLIPPREKATEDEPDELPPLEKLRKHG